MTDIELHAKTDRELLLIAIGQLNNLCHTQERHAKTLYGNGWPGLVFRVSLLWVLVLILGMDNPIVVKILSKVF